MIEISGIFGYTGNQPCNEIMLNGIRKLKSRGSDAAGIAIQNSNRLLHTRLKENCNTSETPVSDEACIALAECCKLVRGNAPYSIMVPATNNLYSVAVDGDIDNFHQLIKRSGEPFPIATNEDLVLALLCVTNNSSPSQDKMQSLQVIASMINGNPTIAFICHNQKAIYCKAGAKPLLIGINKNGFCISSEFNAMHGVADKYIIMSCGEYAKITVDKVYIYDKNLKRIKKDIITSDTTCENAGEYSYNEQLMTLPSITKNIFNNYVKDMKICFEGLRITSRMLNRLESIILTGSGSSFNIANIVRSHLELMSDIPVMAIPSGELRHSGAIIDSDTLVIPFSASGESTDTILAVERSKALGARIISICCNKHSHLAEISNGILFAKGDFSDYEPLIQCNTAMYFSACLFCLYISNKFDIAKDIHVNLALKMAQMLSGKILAATKTSPAITMLATKLSARSNIIVAGLGADYPLSVEAASVFNRISSLNCFAYPICNLIPVYEKSLSAFTIVVPVTNEDYLSVITPYLLRARVLGADIIIITLSNIEEEIKDFENIISFDDSIPLFNSLIILSAIYKTTAIIDEINNSNRLDDAI